ncbi:MAG: hypothetical protein IPJ77_11325 [Planctomycetes bacterium]|nr:hypothetical protein [Planctomycetota bacterium]
MRLSKLLARLEELRDELRFLHGESFDPEVVAAYQPRYPLAGVIHGAAVHEKTVWIAVGGPPATGAPYAPRAAWNTEE